MIRFLYPYLILIGLLLMRLPCACAQAELDLKKCIDIALERNLTVDKGQWSLRSKEVDIKSAKHERLPNLNGYTNLYTNFGQSQDIFGNAARNDNFNGTLGFSSSYSIFNNGKIGNSIKREELLLKANEQDIVLLKRDITIRVMQRYLNLMLQREMSHARDTALVFAQNQLQKVRKSTELGATSLTVLYEAEANYARESEKSIQARFAQDKALLELKQAMGMAHDHELTIADQASFSTLDTFLVDDKSAHFKKSVDNHPIIQKYAYLNESLGFDQKAIAAQRYPTVDASIALGSFYFNNLTTRMGNIPLFRQLQGNFSQQVGLSINFPIFNKHTVKDAIQKNRIQVQENLAQLELEKENIRQELEKYYLDLTNFQNQYASLTNIVEMTKKAFVVSLKSYDAGRISIYDLHLSRSNILAVESELIQAKYNVLFTQILIHYSITGRID